MGNRSPEPPFQFGYEVRRSQRAPMPSGSLNEVNFSSQSPNNEFRRVGHRSSSGRTDSRLHPYRQGVLANSTKPIPQHETQPGPNRIPTDVRYRRPQVRLVNGDRCESALKQMTGPSAARMDEIGIPAMRFS